MSSVKEVVPCRRGEFVTLSAKPFPHSRKKSALMPQVQKAVAELNRNSQKLSGKGGDHVGEKFSHT
jgi:hypothetical protein